MKAGTPDWSKGDEAMLEHLWSIGWNDAALATWFSRTASAVVNKRRELGCCRARRSEPPTPVHRRCVAMREKFTASQIADRLGISRNAVIGHWRRADIAQNRVLKARVA